MRCRTRGDLLIIGEEFEGAIENPPCFKITDHAGVHGDECGSTPPRIAEEDVLVVVVREDKCRDLVGHGRQECIAVRLGEFAISNDSVQEDLDVDLVVAGIHSRRIVDGVRVEAHAVPTRLDATELREPEVATLADDTAAQGVAVDAHGIVCLVTRIGIGLCLRLDVGADTAVPEQVDRCGKDVLDELRRSQRRNAVLDAQA